MLQCCNKIYIGKTSHTLKVLLTEHKSTIRRQDITSPVARHFIEQNHYIDELRCVVITFCFIRHVEKVSMKTNYSKEKPCGYIN